MNKALFALTIIPTFLWIGFVCAISFMEAWLKFRAPGVTLPLGLGIGRMVFNALNKVEWVFLATIIASIALSGKGWQTWDNLFVLIPAIILLAQSFYLLPELDLRAEMIINGLKLPPSRLHVIYVGIEFIKILSLFLFGIARLTYT